MLFNSGFLLHPNARLTSIYGLIIMNSTFVREMNILEITVNTTMGEMLEYDMGIAYVLMQCGMHCVGCPSSIGESLEEACIVHGLNAEEVLAQINEYLATRDAQ